MKSNKIRSIIEIILFCLITLLLNLVSIKNITIFFVFSVISTIPIVVLTIKYKEKVSILASIIIFVSLIMFFPIWEALIKVCIFSLPAISIGYCIRKNYNLKECIIFGATAYVITFIISLFIIKYSFNINIINDFYINNISKFFSLFSVNNNLNELMTSIQNTDVNEYLNKILEFETWWVLMFVYELFVFLAFIGGTNLNLLFAIIPGVITLTGLTISFIVIKTSQSILKNKILNNIEAFSKFSLPFGYGIAFVLTQLILLGSNFRYGTIGIGTSVALNIMLILNFGFMTQGLAVIDYYVVKMGLKSNFRIAVYLVLNVILFAFSIMIILGLIFIGILDYLFNFRKLEIE